MHNNKTEWIEREALVALHECAPAELKSELGLRLEDIDGVLCSASVAEPSILMNRCFGLGQKHSATLDTIHKVKVFYRDAGVSNFFLHLTPGAQPDTVRQMLLDTGMKKARGWMKFIRDATPPPQLASDLNVKKIGPEQADDFARIVAPCFDLFDQSIPLIAHLVIHSDCHLYIGYEGSSPAATGSLFIKAGIAYYDWAATHSDFRRKGYQGAVLRHMINEAIAMGCHSFVTATGEEVAGDPQHSYSNIMRAGFKENYLRENWSPACYSAEKSTA